MRVVYSSEIWATQRRGGISRYFLALARELGAIPGVDVELVAVAHRNDALAESGLGAGVHVPRALDGVGAGRSARLAGRLADRTAWRRLRTARTGPRIWHPTYLDVPGSCGADAAPQVVLTVYDLIHDEFPELFRDAESVLARKRAAYARAHRLSAISHDVKARLIERYPVDPDRVDVVHLGVDHERFHPRDVRDDSRPFVLYVGDRHGYKDFATAVTAIAASSVVEAQLVAFGGGLPTVEERQLLEKHRMLDRTSFTSGDDHRLADLYARASALVVPSKREGFGLPVLEAMACGCPVVSSRAGALTEVGGSAAVFADPGDVDGFATALSRLIEDDEFSADRRVAGMARAAGFTWGATAERTLAAYAAACGQHDLAGTGAR